MMPIKMIAGSENEGETSHVVDTLDKTSGLAERVMKIQQNSGNNLVGSHRIEIKQKICSYFSYHQTLNVSPTNEAAVIKDIERMNICTDMEVEPEYTENKSLVKPMLFNVYAQAINYEGNLTSLVFSSDSRNIFVETDTASQKYWVDEQGKWIQSDTSSQRYWVDEQGIWIQKEINQTAETLRFSDGRYLMSKSDDGRVKIYNGNNGNEVNSKLIYFSSDRKHLAIVEQVNSTHIALIYTLNDKGEWISQGNIKHYNKINSIKFSSSNRYLVTASHDGQAKIYCLNDEGLWIKQDVLKHTNHISSAEFSSDGCYIMTACCNGSVSMYVHHNRDKWKKIINIEDDNPVNSAEFSSDGCHLMTVSGNSRNHVVKIYSFNTNENPDLKNTFCINTKGENCFAKFTPDGRHIVVDSGSRNLQIYGLSIKDEWIEMASIPLERHSQNVILSPCGHYILNISNENKAIDIMTLLKS